MPQDVSVGPASDVATLEAAPGLRGDLGMWVFVVGDMFIFLGYFAVFMVYHAQHQTLFLRSARQLDLTAGLANTLLLITSSRFVALALHATRIDEHRRAIRLLQAGGLCGVAFLAVKAYEWWQLVGKGDTLPHNEFFMFYFTMTGVHLLHVLLGLLVLAIVVVELRSPRLRRVHVVEAGAVYWHMVDLLWVALFALLYLMR